MQTKRRDKKITEETTNPEKLLSPKTSVIIRTRLRAHSTRLLYSRNINADVKGRIGTMLLKLKNNRLGKQAVKIVSYCLNYLAANVNFENPEGVRQFIAYKNVDKSLKKPRQSIQLLRAIQ